MYVVTIVRSCLNKFVLQAPKLNEDYGVTHLSTGMFMEMSIIYKTKKYCMLSV